MTDQTTIAELLRIQSENGGTLQAEAVVEAAKPITSPLHDRFDWDDETAGHKYRLMQARQLIRVVVEYMDIGQEKKAVRVFQSLSTDRKKKGGGYRTTVDVLSLDEHRAQLIEDAIADMNRFQARYSTIRELSEVRSQMSLAQRKLKGRVKKAS